MTRINISRHKTLLVTIVLLLLLDIGRSFYARIGYAEPTDQWTPDAREFTDLMWPPGSDLTADTPMGERVYVERCAVCHGTNGQGTGPGSASMDIRPRNFTTGLYKYKSTLADQPPSDADLTQVVAHGLSASAMPYFDDILSPEEIQAVVGYIKNLSTVFKEQPPETITIPPRVTPDTASIERGRMLYENVGCLSCHGSDGSGGMPFKELAENNSHVLSRNLTAPWTFRGGSEPEQIWLRLTSGMAPSPMPDYTNTLTAEQRWDVVNYVISLSRTPPWQPGGQLAGPGQDPDLLKRGRYLAHTEMCGLCHTPTNITGIYRGNDRWLSGGMWTDAYPHGIIQTANLTSDIETGIGSWTEQELAEAIRTGRTPERLLNPFAMPWPLFYNLKEEDALALARYLKTLPPIENYVPAPLRYGFIETTIAKIFHLPAGKPEVLRYDIYAYGDKARDTPQTLLISAQWVVLLIGIILLLISSGRPLYPKSIKGWTGLLVIGIFGLVSFYLYKLPVLGFIPAEKISQAVTGGFYNPKPEQLISTEQAAMVERGRYLYKVIACGNCHGPDGSGGGKISWGGSQNANGTWNGSGTYWTQNITPDRETGIGGWSDRQIARAIRSGITAQGRQVHWQGMTWDHSGNLDEEDVRAVIAYLHTLPPVKKAIPEPYAPDENSCKQAVVWLNKTNFTEGCQ